MAGTEASSAINTRVKVIALALGVAAATLYAFTAHWEAGGRVNPGDSAKFQYLPMVNGTPHSTGYPMFLMIGKLFHWALPFVPVSARITAISVVCSACTVPMLFLLCYSTSGAMAASVGAAALFATSATFWLVSTDAEVYALHLLFYVSIVWCLIQVLNGSGGGRLLCIGLLLYAMSFSNHLTTIALAPAVLWVVVTVEGRALWRPRTLAFLVAFAVLAIVPYAYIYYLSHWGGGRELEYVGHDVSLSRLVRYVTGQQFKNRFFAFTLRQVLVERSVESLAIINEQLSVAGVALALVGLLRALVRPTWRHFLPVIILAITSQLVIALNYRVEVGLYLLPAHLLLTPFVAMGFASLGRWWLVAPLVVAVTGFHAHQSLTVSPLRLPVAPLLTQARWQSAQAVDCHQLLAAPDSYPISRIRNYLRFTGEYPVAEPYSQLRQIRVVDELCVDSTWKEKLEAIGGFFLSPQADSLAAFFARNEESTVLVSLWVKHGLGVDARRALEGIGAEAARLDGGGAYVGVVHRGHVVVEQLSDDRAKLRLPAGDRFEGFVPRKTLQLSAGGEGLRWSTSIKQAGSELGSTRQSARLLVLDMEQNVVGDASTHADGLENFYLLYRVERSTTIVR